MDASRRWAILLGLTLGVLLGQGLHLSKASAQGGGADALTPPRGQGALPGSYAVPPPPAAPDGAGGAVAVARYPTPPPPAALGSRIGDQLPSRLATRLRVLQTDLTALSGSGGNRVVDGVLSSLSGVLAIALGFKQPHPLDTYLFLWGSANVSRGIIDLALTPNASSAAVSFTHMPSTSLADAELRLAFGEQALERLSRRTRLSRILDSSINIAVGVAVVPIFLGPNHFAISDPLDYFVLIDSGISIVSGLINLSTRSAAERRWSAYRDLRERLEHDESIDATSASRGETRFDGGPLPGGGLLSVTRTF